ncbi:hypothetical protein KKC94_02925, partial [Patescibacteria group bacterium]|nr:hypothetical protein [Patescibacteria group bacterium]
TYRRESNPELGYKYHPFLLYFMGVLPEDEYDTEYTIYDAGGGDSPDPFNSENATIYDTVSINDIIEVAGPRTCSN